MLCFNWYFKNVNSCAGGNENRSFNTSIFGTWVFGDENSLISSELGLRGEFNVFTNVEGNFCYNLTPKFCPRATITYTPFRNINNIQKASFTLGSGIFVSTMKKIRPPTIIANTIAAALISHTELFFISSLLASLILNQAV
mgnify:CR=1 FL=1